MKQIKNITEYKQDYIYEYHQGTNVYILLCIYASITYEHKDIRAILLRYKGDDPYADDFIKKQSVVFWLENPFNVSKNDHAVYELGDKTSMPEYFL